MKWINHKVKHIGYLEINGCQEKQKFSLFTNVFSGILAVKALRPLSITITLCIFVVACTKTNLDLTTDTTPVCTPDAITELNRVQTQTQGVRGLDPVGYYIADYPAEKFGILHVNNWHPLSGYKETLCGQLHHFNVYDGSGAEMDWNQFIIPSPDFTFLITDALPYKGGSGLFCLDDDWHSCVRENDCLEGELTPDESFYENPWFPKSTGDSVLEGRDICMYGPWIRECVHGHRPEIHTAELTWWKERFGNSDLYWLLTFQDDSNRFDDKDDFDIEGTPPAEWRPWAAAPMTSRFDLPFAVMPTTQSITYEIGEAFARNVVTSSDGKIRLDIDNGNEHAIVYNGRVIVRANENQPKDEDLGVLFTEVCRRTDGIVQGYVTLNTKIGINNDGEEGYQVLFVAARAQDETPPVFEIPKLKAKTIVKTRGDAHSIQSVMVNGRLQLQGDFKVNITELGQTQGVERQLEKVELHSALDKKLVPFKYEPKDNSAILTGIPLQDAARFAFIFKSGDSVEVSWPGFTVTSLVKEQVLTSSEADASAWSTVIQAVDGKQIEPVPALKIMHTSKVQLSAVPLYAMRKDGNAAIEDDSPFVERLNEVIASGETGEMKKIFGSDRAITLHWSFDAINLKNGESVPVMTGSSPKTSKEPNTIYAVYAPGKIPNQTVQIDLPEGIDTVYEIRATLMVSDVFGAKNELHYRFWSHYLTDGSQEAIVNPLLRTAAMLADVSPDGLLSVMKLGILHPEDSRLHDPKVRRALIVNNFSRQAASDKQITIDELKSLVHGAKLFGESTDGGYQQ